jgi:hypothetical protein
MRVGHDVPFRLSPDREVRRAWSREFAIGSSRRGRAVTDHWRVARFHRLPGAVARVGCRKSGHARGPGSRSACALPDHLRRPARVGQPSRGARGSGPCSGPGRMPGPGVHGLDAVAEPVRTLGSRARVQHVGELSGARGLPGRQWRGPTSAAGSAFGRAAYRTPGHTPAEDTQIGRLHVTRTGRNLFSSCSLPIVQLAATTSMAPST